MPWYPRSRHVVVIGALLLGIDWTSNAGGQQTPPKFGGTYAELDAPRQRLLNDWVARFTKATGQPVEAGPFYDEVVRLSTKTTFDAVTHALMTTRLTDRSGASLGDALALVERVESVLGEVPGARGDHQFRMLARLTPGALDTLSRSQQFKRGVDNSVYHKGYPTSYRGQGGVPSVQISVAQDGRRADIDVDYRGSSFPIALFNGHLTASNSDVRAGGNYDKHLNRWSGIQNWWRGFFGVRQERMPDEIPSASPLAIPKAPRIGKKNVEVMVNDFLHAWLIEGDVMAAMGYISERSYACLAQDSDDPSDFDRGLAPFQVMTNLKSAQASLGKHDSLNGLTVGTRFSKAGLRVVQQPHHAQFVVYSVPDDIAAAFDCESRLMLGDPRSAGRTYGNYFGATFYVAGERDVPVALLWGRENGYWKIVSWRVGSNDDTPAPAPAPLPEPKVARISADPSFVQAARGFLESWLIRKDYDAAFGYMSPKAYGCYDLERGPEQSASTSPEDAGRRLRGGLETSGKTVGTQRSLEAVITGLEPIHPAIRVMDHPYARVFSLSSAPNALADALECDARASGSTLPDPLPLEYGNAFGLTVRFKTRSGDAPVLRLLWRKENGGWRITSYGIELP
jgi:hypothetical protein